MNTAKARDLLGWTPRDPAETIIDTAESLLALPAA
jgi:nucleoside-diphosphate-sugar epimerase